MHRLRFCKGPTNVCIRRPHLGRLLWRLALGRVRREQRHSSILCSILSEMETVKPFDILRFCFPFWHRMTVPCLAECGRDCAVTKPYLSCRAPQRASLAQQLHDSRYIDIAAPTVTRSISNTPSIKPAPQRFIRYADVFGYLAGGKALIKECQCAVKPDRLGVHLQMLYTIHYAKIFRIVVASVAVYVMHVFAVTKRTPDRFLRNNPVLVYPPAVHHALSVARRLIGAAVGRSAFPVAKHDAEYQARLPLTLLAAVGASYGNGHSDVPDNYCLPRSEHKMGYADGNYPFRVSGAFARCVEKMQQAERLPCL